MWEMMGLDGSWAIDGSLEEWEEAHLPPP